jgi:hypothetical protein
VSTDDVSQGQGPAAGGSVAEIRAANAALVRTGIVPIVVVGLASLAVWAAIDGWSGFAGALVALLLVGAFYGSDIALMRWTARMHPVSVFGVMALTYLFKLTVLAVFLVALRGTDAFSLPAFATTVIVEVSVALLVAVWLSARTTVVIDPEDTGPSNP